MQNRVTKRYWSYRSRGFALPSVLIAVTIFFAILATSCAALTSTNRSMREEWFTSAARHAAESGLAQAKACIAKSNGIPQWTSAKPLRPGFTSSCVGSASACTVVPRCYVVAEGSLRSSYVVSVPEITANGDSYTISAEGTAAIISGGVVSDTRKVIIKQTGGRSLVKFSKDTLSFNSRSVLLLSDEGQVYQTSPGNTSAPILVAGALSGKTVTQAVVTDAPGVLSISYPAHYALTSDGKVYSWGNNTLSCDLLGNCLMTASTVPVAVEGVLAGKIVTKIAASSETVWALTSDGALYAWGCNDSGQFGNGTTTKSGVPVGVTMSGVLAGKTITSIMATGSDSVMVRTSDGKLYSWGRGSGGRHGNGSTSSVSTPGAVIATGVLAGKSITKMYPFSGAVFAIDTDGKVYAWGSNLMGMLGVDASVPMDGNMVVTAPAAVDVSGVLAGKSITQIASSAGQASQVYALSSTGVVYGWGTPAGESSKSLPIAVGAPSGVSFAQLCADGPYTYGISTAGVLYRTTSITTAFTQFDSSGVLAGKAIAAIGCRQGNIMAISADGQLYTWASAATQVKAVSSPTTWQLDGIVY